MSEYVFKQVFLPDDVIIDIKSFCLKQSKKSKSSYKIYDFMGDAIEHLSKTKVKAYVESFCQEDEGISAFSVRFHRSYESLCRKCLVKAASEINEEVSERRLILNAILCFLEKHGLYQRSYA